jgi:hypothetical protein
MQQSKFCFVSQFGNVSHTGNHLQEELVKFGLAREENKTS